MSDEPKPPRPNRFFPTRFSGFDSTDSWWGVRPEWGFLDRTARLVIRRGSARSCLRAVLRVRAASAPISLNSRAKREKPRFKHGHFLGKC